MRRVAAQLRQVTATRFVWICQAACLGVLTVFFTQFALRRDSDLWDARAGAPAVVVAYMLWMFASLFGVLPTVAVGSFLGAKDSRWHTGAALVLGGGRWPALGAKVAALAIATFAAVAITVAWGLLLGWATTRGWAGIPPVHLAPQAGLAFVVGFMTGLAALTVATLIKSVALSNIICYTALLGLNYLPGAASRALQWLNPMAYVARPLAEISPELAYARGITVSPDLTPTAVSLSVGAAVLATEVVVLGLVCLRRDVD
jgi:hypothetical protein